jgi:uncharacterized protein YkwD
MLHRTAHRCFNSLRILAGFSLTIALFSCQAAHSPAPRAQALPKPSVRVQDLEQRIHILINRERKTRGLSTLGWDDRLSRIARNHSKDMASRSYFSHESPEGRDFPFRYQEQGYTCSIRTGTIIHMGAENIALGHLYRSIRTVNGVVSSHDWYTLEQLAQEIVLGWMHSSGHRKNILTPHWQNEGIGISVAPNGAVYVTQNFC